jgi:N-acetylmuramate 1-kinase
MTQTVNVEPPSGLEDFLSANGWDDAVASPIPGDASFRRYLRVSSSACGNAILMDAPPPHEDVAPFINVAEYLSANGFRAPEIFARDVARGLVLLEDFGDSRMREHLDENPHHEERIYRQAIDVIIRLSRRPAANVPPYDLDAYLREVRLLAEWYMPAAGLPFNQAEFDEVWKNALAPLAHRQDVTVLRDYHAENIMLLANGEQGLIDFQDALVGHPAYDLVSLLQDARRDVSPALEAEMLRYYRREAQAEDDFDHHYALIGAQRNTKIIGIFTRLWKRDGKDRYLSFLPRMWSLLERDLAHPALAPLQSWFDLHISSAARSRMIGDASK